MFKGYYQKRFREIFGTPLNAADGLGEKHVQRELTKRRITIPRALADYYSVAGLHPVNSQANRLYSISKLAFKDDWLIFMEEEQCVVYWAIAKNDVLESNPLVWQAANHDPFVWYKEPYHLKQFLTATWKWQEKQIEERPERGKRRASDRS